MSDAIKQFASSSKSYESALFYQTSQTLVSFLFVFLYGQKHPELSFIMVMGLAILFFVIRIRMSSKLETTEMTGITNKNIGNDEPELNKALKLVIFDWDDTLYPTTSIIKNKENVSGEDLQKLGRSIYVLLDKYINIFGAENIFIITNAAHQWILYSLIILNDLYKQKTKDNEMDNELNYFAAIYNSLISLNIGMISAQYLYSKQYPNNPPIWKILAFKQIAKQHFNLDQSHENNDYVIISIGDSNEEFYASLAVKSMLTQQYEIKDNNVTLHSIKLKNKPSINDMTLQIKLLIDKYV